MTRRLLRIALPLGALSLIAAIFLFPSPNLDGFRFSDVSVEGDGMRLESPRYDGVTDDGAPYSLIADWALPDGPDPKRVELGPLRAEIDLSTGRRAVLTAQGGVFRPPEKRLTLSGGLRGETSDGYRLEAPSAMGDFTAKTLDAPGPVRLFAPTAALEAGAMRAWRGAQGDVILFEQGVKLRINRQDAPAEGESR